MKLQLIRINHQGSTHVFKTITEMKKYFKCSIHKKDLPVIGSSAIHNRMLDVEIQDGKLHLLKAE